MQGTTSHPLSVQGMGGDAVHAASRANRSWTSLAFLVEALLLLLFLAGSIAVTVNVSLKASSIGAEASQLSAATSFARNIAEKFSADPTATAALEEAEGDLFAICDVVEKRSDTGVLYNATINVYSGDHKAVDPVYTLQTAKFVSAPVQAYSKGAVTPEPIGTTVDADEVAGDDMPGAGDSSFVDEEAVSNG